MSSKGRAPISPRADEPPKAPAPENRRSSVILGPRDRLIGELHIEGDLHLDGQVEGEISATGDVEIADAANVKASVAGGDVNILGHVNGSVTARKRLVVGRSGSLIGDVRVARLVIQDGAKFSGNVSMGPHAAEAPPKAHEPVVAEPVSPEPVAAEPIAPQAEALGESVPSEPATDGRAKPMSKPTFKPADNKKGNQKRR